MSFLYPGVFWIGLPLLALPILIHLLNPQRQRQIRWAAMQFLQESQRRSRTWILLRQFLLLAARVAAIGLVVLLLSQMILQNSWARFFGQGETHHVVLLDDSFSMTDREADRTAWDNARRVVSGLVDQARRSGELRRLTLLTFSEAARLAVGDEPRFYDQVLTEEQRPRIASHLVSLQPNEMATGLGDALRGVARLPQELGERAQTLHVLSDLRAAHFSTPEDVREILSELAEIYDAMHMVQCVRRERPNLAITSLAPESGLRAAGVESWMVLGLANYGDRPARDVSVRLEQDGTALPALVVPEVPPGEQVSHRFRVRMATAGPHELIATLEDDAILPDNHRFFACQLPVALPVLIVDQSPGARDAFYLATALDPGGRTVTGWAPQIDAVDALRDGEALAKFAAVCLLDVGRLDDAAVDNLERYVSAGGGVGVFLGENTNRQFANARLYRSGQGLLPIELGPPTQLLDRVDDNQPDVKTTQHPLFRALAGRRNSFLALLAVDYAFAPAESWQPQPQVDVLARLRDGRPLVVEKKFGKGRVVVHLTKLAPTSTRLGRWSNWAVNPVFPVLANELLAYLAAGHDLPNSVSVGQALQLEVAADGYGREFVLDEPQDTSEPGVAMTLNAQEEDGKLVARIDAAEISGIYRWQLSSAAGAKEERKQAVNVEADEGNLALISHENLRRIIPGVDFDLHYADELQGGDQRLAGFQMSGMLLTTVVGLLLVEQLLAYLASYHAPRHAGRTSKEGRA